MRNKGGIARKNFRADGGRVWKPATRKKEAAPEATEARRRMIEEQGEEMNRKNAAPVRFAEAVADQQARTETPGHLTNTVVNDYMGGNDAAVKQAKAYDEVFESIKAGRTKDKKGSLADEARRRMIEREEAHPDAGRDKANRRAYPKHE